MRIKQKRRISEQIDKKDQVKFIEEQLDNAKIELIHWFTKFSNIETENQQLSATIDRLNDSLEFYTKKNWKKNAKKMQILKSRSASGRR